MKISDFFLWLAAADRNTLARLNEGCREREAAKQRTLGMTLLLPTTAGFLAMSIYVGKLLDNLPAALFAGAVWSLAILTIDRFMLTSYRPFAPFRKRVLQVCLRLALVLLTAATISHPLCLLLFQHAIKETYDNAVKRKIDAALKLQEDRMTKIVANYERDMKPLNEATAKLEEEESKGSAKREALARNRSSASKVWPELEAAKSTRDALTERLAKEKADLAACETELKKIRGCIDSERREGHNSCTENGEETKTPGKKFTPAQQRDPHVCPRLAALLPMEDALKDQQAAQNQKIKELGRSLDEAQAKVDEEQAKARRAGADAVKGDDAWLDEQMELWRTGLQKDKEENAKLITSTRAKWDDRKSEEEKAAKAENDRLKSQQSDGPKDPMQENLALWHVMMNGTDEATANAGLLSRLGGFFLAALIFGMLMTADSFPVVMKFLSPGPYEREVHIDEETARLEQKARLAALPGHVYRQVHDRLNMETRRNLEELHRLERERNRAEGHPGNPDFD